MKSRHSSDVDALVIIIPLVGEGEEESCGAYDGELELPKHSMSDPILGQ